MFTSQNSGTQIFLSKEETKSNCL